MYAYLLLVHANHRVRCISRDDLGNIELLQDWQD